MNHQEKSRSWQRFAPFLVRGHWCVFCIGKQPKISSIQFIYSLRLSLSCRRKLMPLRRNAQAASRVTSGAVTVTNMAALIPARNIPSHFGGKCVNFRRAFQSTLHIPQMPTSQLLPHPPPSPSPSSSPTPSPSPPSPHVHLSCLARTPVENCAVYSDTTPPVSSQPDVDCGREVGSDCEHPNLNPMSPNAQTGIPPPAPHVPAPTFAALVAAAAADATLRRC
jgi:hypothetical protein